MVDIEEINHRTISSIETFFDKLLRGTLTKNLYFGELPVSIAKGWDDLVVVDCSNPIRDYGAYAAGTVTVSLYALKDKYGTKNVNTMQRLEKKLNELIQNNADPVYKVKRRGAYSSYGAINDTFINIIQIDLIIT